jgi:hypothetical protein
VHPAQLRYIDAILGRLRRAGTRRSRPPGDVDARRLADDYPYLAEHAEQHLAGTGGHGAREAA